MDKSIAIICGYPFPNGLAATNRILAYSKGLIELGFSVDIFIFFPTESNKQPGINVNGSIYGINYHYPSTRVYPPNRLIRLISHYYFMIITAFNIYKQHRKKKFSYVFISTDWFRNLYFFIPFTKLLGIKSVFFADEFPIPIRKYLKDEISQFRRFLFRNCLRFVDGMVFMTESLTVFYNEIINKPSLVLPTIIDISRFLNVSKSEINLKKSIICYMGNMELSKDNVDNIIKAFALISNTHEDWDIHLYGQPSAADSKTLTELISELGLQNRVLLKGKIDSSRVPEVLANSSLLVSSQPLTKRAQGGFPTKLGEYMATGVPTLITDVGEIRNYVTPGVNIYLAEAENPEDYAKNISEIILNYEKAQEIAQNGKQYVSKSFDYKTQGLRLAHFLTEL